MAANELRWIAYQLISTLALGVAACALARAGGLRQWWLNLVALPLLGVASATGSVVGGAVVFRGWYRMTGRVAPNDRIVDGRIMGAVLAALPLRAVLAPLLVGRAWPRTIPLPAPIWGIAPIPLALALVALDDEAEAAAKRHEELRMDNATHARSDRALSEDLAALRRPYIKPSS